MSSMKTDIVEKLMRAYAERLDREIEGAYRAGYDYLYIGTKIGAEFKQKFVSIPTEKKLSEETLGGTEGGREFNWTEYELCKIDEKVFIEAKEGRNG